MVHEHPEYADLPVTLEVLLEEVEALQGASRFVTVEWIAPGARKGERMVVSLDDFNLLAGAGVMESAVQDALIAKHRNRPFAWSPAAGRGRAAVRWGKVNYATLEHAGEPHRGRIIEAEKEPVRRNLDQVNRRLREAGQREIDPSDQAMRDHGSSRDCSSFAIPCNRVAGPARRTGRTQPLLQEVVLVARLRVLVGAILAAALVLARGPGLGHRRVRRRPARSTTALDTRRSTSTSTAPRRCLA